MTSGQMGTEDHKSLNGWVDLDGGDARSESRIRQRRAQGLQAQGPWAVCRGLYILSSTSTSKESKILKKVIKINELTNFTKDVNRTP